MTDDAVVVARGERLRVWFLRQGESWVKAKDHPSAVVDEAQSERADGRCPPGTVWRRTVDLEVPVGTLLRATTSSPLEQQRLNPIEYLTRGKSASRRRVSEALHRVVGDYRLERVAKE